MFWRGNLPGGGVEGEKREGCVESGRTTIYMQEVDRKKEREKRETGPGKSYGPPHLLHLKFAAFRAGITKSLCDTGFAESLCELSGAICLEALVLMGSALEVVSKFVGAVRVILGLCESFLHPEHCF